MGLFVGLVISAGLGYWAYRLWTGSKAGEGGATSKIRKPLAIVIGFFAVAIAVGSINVATMSPEKRARLVAERKAEKAKQAKADAAAEAKEAFKAKYPEKLRELIADNNNYAHCVARIDGIADSQESGNLGLMLRQADSGKSHCYNLSTATEDYPALKSCNTMSYQAFLGMDMLEDLLEGDINRIRFEADGGPEYLQRAYALMETCMDDWFKLKEEMAAAEKAITEAK